MKYKIGQNVLINNEKGSSEGKIIGIFHLDLEQKYIVRYPLIFRGGRDNVKIFQDIRNEIFSEDELQESTKA